MAGIQLSGLINGSFDWQSVVNELIQLDSEPITTLQTAEATNNSQLAAYTQLSGDFTTLQTAAYALQADGVFNGVTASSTTSGSSWTATADNGTAAGNYSFDVSQLATPAYVTGLSHIANPLATTSDVSGITLATMPTATAVTAGNFTVDGQTVAVTTSESLQDVFNAIATATSGNVTASYDPSTDKVTLTSADSSEIVLGAANDTSNFLSAMELSNNGTDTVTSANMLGSVAMNSPVQQADLKTALTGLNSSGDGYFTINGVTIGYNASTDSLATIMTRINDSGAGVTANFDPTDDRMVLTNNSTGDVGLGVQDTTGNLMSALGLTTSAGATFTHGLNAEFSLNGGSTTSSLSNTLSDASTGVSGLAVTVNSTGTQTIAVTPNTSNMQTTINSFITAFNTLQSDITAMTTTTANSNGTVTDSVLSGNQEVPQWATDLRNLAFNSISGLSGDISSLDALGIGYTGISNQLSITDQTTLTNALTNDPNGVAEFFQDPTKGLAAEFINYTDKILAPNTGGIAVETTALNDDNANDATKISQLQIQVDAERTSLTNEFLAMQNAQSQANSEEEIISSIGGGSSSSSSSSSSGSSSSATVSDNGTTLSSSGSTSSSTS